MKQLSWLRRIACCLWLLCGCVESSQFGFVALRTTRHFERPFSSLDLPNQLRKDCPRPGIVFSTITTAKHARAQDNLISGLSEISLAFSIGVLWSEYFIASTGCGPPNFSDALERICYQGVIVSAGLALFHRIVTFGGSLEDSAEKIYGPLEESTLLQVKITEWSNALAIAGAFLSLGYQYGRGARMDGLSGIDVSMCRAIQENLGN